MPIGKKIKVCQETARGAVFAYDTIPRSAAMTMLHGDIEVDVKFTLLGLKVG